MGEIINFFLKFKSLIEIREFRLRFISTIILFTTLFLLFLIGNPFFVIFLTLLFSLLFYEFETIDSTNVTKSQFLKLFIIQSTLLIYLFLKMNVLVFDSYFNVEILLISSFLINLIYYKKYNSLISFIISNCIILSFYSLINILLLANGLNLFLYLVILISVMDISAYLGGNLLGNKKIVPKISRGKTIEGTLVGLGLTIFVAILIKDLINLDFLISLFLGFSIAILSFLGDILESLFKRKVGVKDSGKLIPGHGGLMDRFDGYVIVLPFFYIFLISFY
ncbi:MAG: phosphatidate cytidylyltransferase [Alphaproteobacteria bacterium]|nr:phosphatidate cytidylyltransferase [Alphaproteobacteria bacterium]